LTLAGQTTNLIFGRIYDSHAVSSPLGSPTCVEGRACYVDAFKITAGMGFGAICVAVVLATQRKGMRVRAA
jgi:hypothetical protein